MIKVKLQTNWCSPYEIREHFNRCTINGDYKWNDLVMVDTNNPVDYDFNIIFNTPYRINKNYDRKNSIVFQCEPLSTISIFKNEYGFDPYAYDDWYYFYDTQNHHNVDKWYVSLNFKQLLEPDRFVKIKSFSSVISDTRGLPGHEYRINFAKLLDASINDYDNFGRRPPFYPFCHHRGMLINKEDGLANYKYTLGVENTNQNGYLTEKFIDAILCECLLFYSGAPNADKFINPQAFIQLDLTKPQEALEIIKASIANNEWEKRISFIREEKKKLMTTLNPLNIIESLIKFKKPPYDLIPA